MLSEGGIRADLADDLLVPAHGEEHFAQEQGQAADPADMTRMKKTATAVSRNTGATAS